MAYKKDTDYSALIDEAVAAGNYKNAAMYEQQRNEKIGTEGLGYQTTNRYSGWLDDTDYGAQLEYLMSNGASAGQVSDTLSARIKKSSGTEGLSQYAYDEVYDKAIEYLQNGGTDGGFSYENAPEYVYKYTDLIDSATQQLLGREKFSYDYSADPLYQQYADAYTREGNRAMQDTLGQVSARTGGLASSYATTAAAAANNYYMQQLGDKIPELQQLAYSMYQDDYSNQYNNLQMLMSLDNADYNKYLTNLGQYNTDRSFNYGVYSDDWNRDYQTSRDAVSDAQYADTTAYNRMWDQTEWDYGTQQDQLQRDDNASAQARDEVLSILQAGGTPSAELIAASGYTPEFIAAMGSYFAQQAAGTSSSGGYGGSGSSGSSDAYKTVLSNAKGYDDLSGSVDYLNRMVDGGYITADEAAYIYQVELGGAASAGGENTPATGSGKIMDKAEFAFYKSKNSAKVAAYKDYGDYLSQMYQQYK